jgi:hypothetical protein
VSEREEKRREERGRREREKKKRRESEEKRGRETTLQRLVASFAKDAASLCNVVSLTASEP